VALSKPTHAGLRHLALNVRDLEAMKRFYVDLLSFSVEWEPDADNVYLSSGVDNLALHRSSSRVAGSDAASGGALDRRAAASPSTPSPARIATAPDRATSGTRTATSSRSFIIRQLVINEI